MPQGNFQKFTQLQDWLGKEVTVHFTGRIDSNGQEQFASERPAKIHTLGNNYVVLCFHFHSKICQEFGGPSCEKTLEKGTERSIVEERALGHLVVPLQDITLEPMGEGIRVVVAHITWGRPQEEVINLCKDNP